MENMGEEIMQYDINDKKQREFADISFRDYVYNYKCRHGINTFNTVCNDCNKTILLGSELLRHQVDYLLKEVERLSSNETKCWKGCNELDERIKTLEESYAGLAAEIRHLMQERDKGVERIKKLEERLSNLSHSLEFCLRELDKKGEKTPHKCPVCNGLGYWPVKLLTKDQDIQDQLSFSDKLICKSCKGTGIVWSDA